MTAHSPRILLVDDDARLLRLLSIRLTGEGFKVETAGSGKQALARLSISKPDLVITDLRMDGMDGMALFEVVHARHPTLPVVILTAHGTIPEAVEATRRGVSGYLTKPFNSRDLVEFIRRTLRVSGDAPSAEEDDAWRARIVTRSPAMAEVLEHARRAAASDVSVLIQSASGTGKELLARSIHDASPRRHGPFVALNCSAVPEQLLESELFGHDKGSFTGATRSHRGLFQSADGGTLFLDEVGDMPLGFQAKLLRAIEQKEVRPIGSTASIAIDVRILCATHRDLERAIAEGHFREDLYYRLNVVMLELPPLRDRPEDIALLANHFLTATRERSESSVVGFSAEAMEVLAAAPWPGNVRQLRNVVEQCVVLSTTPIVSSSLVQRALRGREDELLSLAEARDRFEFDYLTRLLQITEGNVSQAARIAERNRSEFYKLLRRHQLDPGLFRGDRDD